MVCRWILGLCVGLPGFPALSQVTAQQGPRDPNEFHGSMILEAPFPPANPAARLNDWSTTPDYSKLRLYQCDGVRITGFQFRVKKPTKDGKVPVGMRIWLFSPDQNHDKMVELTLEIHNGDKVVGTVKRSVKVEEARQVKRDLDVLLPSTDLIAEPITQLRITVQTKDV